MLKNVVLIVDSYYFDHMASSPTHPDVVDAMLRCLDNDVSYANPHATHPLGQSANHQIQLLTHKMLCMVSQQPGDLIWTSGATESINLALQGACRQYRYSGKHIVSLTTEHSATLETLHALSKEGFHITLLPVQKDGLVCLDRLKNALSDDTILFSACHVNNEIGVIQNIAAMAKTCREKGVLFHVDCAQSIGKAPLPLPAHVDFASFSAHKCQGPKGIGALFISHQPTKKIKKIIHGGEQQNNIRSGTLPLFLIAGFVKACEINHNNPQQTAHCEQLFNHFKKHFHPDIKWNGSLCQRALQNVNVTLPARTNPNDITALKNNFSLSSQSACRSKKNSLVLNALGLSPEAQSRTLRISTGSETTLDQVVQLCEAINALCA